MYHLSTAGLQGLHVGLVIVMGLAIKKFFCKKILLNYIAINVPLGWYYTDASFHTQWRIVIVSHQMTVLLEYL